METISIILGAVVPVYLIVTLGFVLRKRDIVSGETESTLFKLLINLWVPCLVINVVARNPAFDEKANIIWPPLMGFMLVAIGIFISWIFSKIVLRKTKKESINAFAYTTGVFNYGYIPIPLISTLFDHATLGVLFVFNVGVEIGLWLFGMPMMAGSNSIGQVVKKILNPPLITLVLCVGIRLLNLGDSIPAPIWNFVEVLSGCTIPIGILLVGMAMADHVKGLTALGKPGAWTVSLLIRLGIMPLIFIWVAGWFHFTTELTAVIAIQAAMPCAVFPVVLAKHYGGDARTATQIIFATSALAFLSTPLWLDYAFKILKLSPSQ